MQMEQAMLDQTKTALTLKPMLRYKLINLLGVGNFQKSLTSYIHFILALFTPTCTVYS